MEKVNFQGENSTRHVCLLRADHLAAGAELLAFSALTHPYGTLCFVGLLPFAPPPIFQVAPWEKQIYTCCRDGVVRRYQLGDL